jgi:hypothetical protein
MKLLHLTSLLTPILIPGTFALREDGGDSGLSKSLRERDAALTATPDGICHIYTVQAGETCGALATRYGITTANIETWNAGAWGWTGCTGIKQGDFICLSSGDLPMPASLPQAVCGPQVPGAARPIRYSDVGSLNPCVSGQCVSTKLFLSTSNSR